MCYQILIEPSDKLFFRDAKPIGGASVGEGAAWPLPSVFHSAMMSALSNEYPDPIKEGWESEHVNLSRKEKLKHKDGKEIVSNFRFGGLRTLGIFPVKRARQQDGSWKDEIFVPTPADIEPGGSTMKLIANFAGYSNLPSPLKYLVANTEAPSKKMVYPWILVEDFEKYLNGERVPETHPNSEFFDSETAPGIAIDPNTGTAEDKKFYQATYLRMKADTSMLAFAECDAKKYDAVSGIDVLGKLFESRKTMLFVIGGQRGMAFMECKREKTALCKITDTLPNVSGNRIKWTLLSPAIFNNGWLPDWIDARTGKVMLKARPDKNGKSRKDWRKEIENAPQIGANLVAARIPKPLVLSGWKLDKDADSAGGGPKATRLAVPAGAVYYFECDNADEAKKLVEELHGTVKSSLLGEQGFGLGVCSHINKNEVKI